MRLKPLWPGPKSSFAGAGIDAIRLLMTPARKQLISRLFLIGLMAVATVAGLQISKGQTPLLISGGLLLCALAPLIFLLYPPKGESRQHPVVISALIALGCVMMMAGIQRFGEDHQAWLGLAVGVLVAWMLFQRKIWRA